MTNSVFPLLGTGEVYKKPSKALKRTMAKMTGYQIMPADYRNQNRLLIRGDDYDKDILPQESMNALYHFFSVAHGKLSYIRCES